VVTPTPNPQICQKTHLNSNISHLVEDCRIAKQSVAQGRGLGHGTFGRVTLEIDAKTHERLAVKHLSRTTDRAHLMREVEALVKLRHPRIIRILRWVAGDESSGGEIQMEFAPHDTLGWLIYADRTGRLTPFRTPTGKARIICDIVMGMRYAHAQRIMHRDLKPCNILIDEDWGAKIGDFGLSRLESDEGPMTGETGTIGYAAPEQLSDEVGPTTKTDVFSFGLILYEILTGERVFRESEPMTIVRRLRARQFPTVPEKFGRLMQDLIVRGWAADQRARPSFDQILKEFQGVGFQILPGVDAESLRKSVNDVLKWEHEQKNRKQ
jgi:serine/threonine protein kinase